MSTRNRKGFGVVEGIILVAILLVIGGLAWYALRSKTPASSSPTPTSTTITSTTPDPQATFSMPIKEMGINLKAPVALAGIYYSYSPSANQASLSTGALLSIDPQCAADKTGTAMITSTKSPDMKGDENKTPRESYPNGLTVDNTYYYLMLGDGPCTNSEKVGEARTLMSKITLEKL